MISILTRGRWGPPSLRPLPLLPSDSDRFRSRESEREKNFAIEDSHTTHSSATIPKFPEQSAELIIYTVNYSHTIWQYSGAGPGKKWKATRRNERNRSINLCARPFTFIFHHFKRHQSGSQPQVHLAVRTTHSQPPKVRHNPLAVIISTPRVVNYILPWKFVQ